MDQAAIVIAYSFSAPVLAVVVAYAIFFVRAPFRIVAERTAELRNFRIQNGQGTADLDAPKGPGWFRSITISVPLANFLFASLNVFLAVFIILGISSYVKLKQNEARVNYLILQGQMTAKKADALKIEEKTLLVHADELKREQTRIGSRLDAAEKLHAKLYNALRDICSHYPSRSECSVLKEFHPPK